MPKPVKATATTTDEIPASLRPYTFHGVDISPGRGGEATGTCPFCDSAKFYVALDSGLAQCKVCGVGSERGGLNHLTFLRELWKRSYEATNGQSKALAEDRGLMYPETLTVWEVAASIIDGEWLVPGYNASGKLSQLYRYVRGKGGKRLLLATPEHGHGLHGVHLYDAAKPDLFLCEGPWDGAALWEALKCSKAGDGGLVATSSEAASLLATSNVLAAPGCNVFQEAWLPLFAGKRVYIMYDSDHPKTVRSKSGGKDAVVPPAGYEGARRAAQQLAAAEQPPAEIHVLTWGPDGYDPDRKSGADVRDLLVAAGSKPAERAAAVNGVLGMVKPIPERWVRGRTKAAGRIGGTEIECVPCSSWKVLVNAWRRAMKWTPGLEGALANMLAAVVSTDASGSQLWFKIMGPPSCGKSTICEALSVNKKYTYANSSLTGIHSGWKTDSKGDEDHSLIPKIKDKTFIIKDGDGLLKANNRDKTLADLRDLYDRTSRVHYLHGVSRAYEGIAMTMLLCGTDTLRVLDKSELGARFLDYVIMEGIDEELEGDITRRVVNRTFANLAGGRETATGHDDEAMTRVKQLTGGYIDHLRQNGEELLASVATATLAEAPEVLDYMEVLGPFVAFARARPSKEHEEVAERELGARLSEQFSRQAVCLAVVYNRDRVDGRVMALVRKTAMDTARGVVLKIFDGLHRSGDEGAEPREVASWITTTEARAGELLRFLRKIEAAERFQPEGVVGVRGKWRVRLTDRMRKLYDEVVVPGKASVS